MDQATDPILQMPTKTKSPKSPPVAPSHHENIDSNKPVPFSIRVPAYVVAELETAAGVGTGSAMGRKVLTDWADDRRR